MADITDQIHTIIKTKFPKLLREGGFASIDELMVAQIDDIDLDSLDRLELVMGVEDLLDITLEEDAVIACETLTALINLAKQESLAQA